MQNFVAAAVVVDASRAELGPGDPGHLIGSFVAEVSVMHSCRSCNKLCNKILNADWSRLLLCDLLQLYLAWLQGGTFAEDIYAPTDNAFSALETILLFNAHSLLSVCL